MSRSAAATQEHKKVTEGRWAGGSAGKVFATQVGSPGLGSLTPMCCVTVIPVLGKLPGPYSLAKWLISKSSEGICPQDEDGEQYRRMIDIDL